MKASFKFSLLFLLLASYSGLQAQFLVEGYGFNGGMLIGAGYEVEDKMTLEWRVGTSTEDIFTSHFLIANFQFINREEVEVYTGPGYAFFTNTSNSFLWPIGANIYPFKQKNFGFHMELMPSFSDGGAGLLGLWGIRYRFGETGKGKKDG